MVSTVATDQTINVGDVYKKHNFSLNTDARKELPIDSYKSQILSRVEQNQVIVIEGPTGCGKTTQVPQMIMDFLREKNQYCNIVVTQPRKIATINVAKRVCEERGWTLGTVCGYQVGLEKKVSPEELITYMTIGVLLQKLIRAKNLRQYTHIIIDEVHERNQELDFLLLIVRKFLFTNSPQTKVILMSATINASDFAFYFRKRIAQQSIPAHIVTVTKPSLYTTKLYYLDQMAPIKPENIQFDLSNPEISQEIWGTFAFLVNVFDKLTTDVELNSDSVLVFLPGINEIEEAHKILKKEEEVNKDKKRLKWEIIPLHSSLPNDEQALAFRPAKPGYKKIILSTNIAESSVTVPDIGFVIDFCLTKVMTVDPITKFMSLKLEWASRVNCEQRAGRVGRTCNGRVYRLVTESFYNYEMQKTSVPEILRAPLAHVVLHTKMLELTESPSQILALAMDPPNLKNIQSTIWELKEIGGMLNTCRGIPCSSDGDLTFLGQVMATLPLDVRLSKLIVLGQLFSCLEETIIIAAGCSIQNIFSIPFQKRLDAYKKLLLWADGSSSDPIALLNLYGVWKNLIRENSFQSHREELQWCQRNLVSLKGLREWNLLITEIKERLNRLQLKETSGPGKVELSIVEKPTVLKVVMAGAFYPNYFIKSSEGNPNAEREAVKVVGSRDPFCTVYFTGLDPQQPGKIYVRQIKNMITDKGESCSDVNIGFDGSTKIYIEFKNPIKEGIPVNIDGSRRLMSCPGKVPRQVYEMLRKRQLKYNFELKCLPVAKAWEFAESRGSRGNRNTVTERNCFSSINYCPIPAMSIQYSEIIISCHIDAGHFWAQNPDEKTNELLQQIEEALNGQELIKVDEELKIGKIYAARYKDDGRFYRCRVTATAGRINQIIFIDYGNLQEVTRDELYYIPQRPQCYTVPLAFECVMYGIKPAYRHNPLGIWPENINRLFKQWTDNVVLYIEIYSVVNEVVELELYRSVQKDRSINRYLLDQGYADPCSPSFLSKQNHDLRLQIQQSNNPPEEEMLMTVDQIVSYTDFDSPDISGRDCIRVPLRGPFNPLETKLFGCTIRGCPPSVDIEGNSVNAVMLDTEPGSLHSRLLVAGNINQTPGNKLKLRQTTLMPNLPGFPMLMAAIFSPVMEPKLTPDKSLVAAILCGLGYNESTGKPLYPVHDMLIKLDTELTVEEIQMVNRLRYIMNTGIKLMYDIEQNRTPEREFLNIQYKIKDHLFRLINMERDPIIRDNIYPEHTSWGRHGGMGLLQPSMENDQQDIWKLHWFIKVVRMSAYQKQITKNLEDMQNYTYNVKPFEEVTCQLCDVECLFIDELRYHLISSGHKKRVALFNESLEQDDSSSEE
ncbi:probable ATP-dependent RNA helicase spindle-E [Anthonomus grandis grandis]|uniref:probable ATP-dependent RNA helicase spindle-E n=1 Tax=Anthonomus grandis grandis TaxID=2921223 RepID=UPI002165C27D|nr:probable ATP-dependent RNA helicase spindle-E [Anthonomus grandis grandis]XP_050300295.1 probable ATP-dependent RNA helicase spindle-E [Anthonomus grandis grandis]